MVCIAKVLLKVVDINFMFNFARFCTLLQVIRSTAWIFQERVPRQLVRRLK
jgi:hypothetical protein